jgi:hypothetical protein
MKQQKTVSIMRSPGYDFIMGESAGDSYLFSQCKGNSGIDKDLSNGWMVKHIWEDSYAIVILLERPS